jgi:hypothetical protein
VEFILFDLDLKFSLKRGFEKQIEKKRKKYLPAGGPVKPAYCLLLSCSGPRNGPTSLPLSLPRSRLRGPAQHS